MTVDAENAYTCVGCGKPFVDEVSQCGCATQVGIRKSDRSQILCKKASLAQISVYENEATLAELDALRSGAEAWSWLADNSSLELSYEGWEDDEWQVHSVTGGRSDREWTKIATGPTPLAAITAARAALQQKDKDDE